MFLTHCHIPQFVMEVLDGGRGTPVWIGEPFFDPSLGDPAQQCARLMRDAGDYFSRQR